MEKQDIVVVGGGHAGIEATLSAARLGFKVGLVTLNYDMVGSMPCNPSLGGPAKGVVVREIDSLGGEMAKAADATYLQIKMLNTAKGPGVQCLRVQSDKIEYKRYMQRVIKENPNVTIYEQMGTDLIVEDKVLKGVVLEDGTKIECKAAILTTGTYLHGKILRGHTFELSGPEEQRAAYGISEALEREGIDLLRLKTGTPPRLQKDTLDYSVMEVQPGIEGELSFSYSTRKYMPLKDQHVCYLIHTTPETHKLIQDNLGKSAMYGGMVEGVGPRYCPSIEDKIVKFADKERHQLFIEPESVHLDTIYLQGFSTSMPIDVQDKMIRSLPGLKDVKVIKYAYAIEYDAIDPMQLKPTLELKDINGLYCAGQINGTSGYEEAAAQGLMAGINACLKLQGKKPFILSRDEAYIGVMIDDLINKAPKEPYRLLTSRAEYRLLLRHDNADQRLMKYGHEIGLLKQEEYDNYLKKCADVESILEYIKEFKFGKGHKVNEELVKLGYEPLEGGIRAYELLKRPYVTMKLIAPYLELKEEYRDEVLQQVEIRVKYEGYIAKQRKEAEDRKKFDSVELPEDIDYNLVPNLALEARQKLNKVKPLTIGQASRIAGVDPTDITLLLLYLKMRKED